MKVKVIVCAVALVATMSGCSRFLNRAHLWINGTLAGNYKVQLWSGSQPVKTWHVKNGFVNTEDHTDGWYFMTETGLVRVSGNVSIEQE